MTKLQQMQEKFPEPQDKGPQEYLHGEAEVPLHAEKRGGAVAG